MTTTPLTWTQTQAGNAFEATAAGTLYTVAEHSGRVFLIVAGDHVSDVQTVASVEAGKELAAELAAPAEDLAASFPETPEQAELTARVASEWLAEASEDERAQELADRFSFGALDLEPSDDELAEADEAARYEDLADLPVLDLAAFELATRAAKAKPVFGPAGKDSSFVEWHAALTADPWVPCGTTGHLVGSIEHAACQPASGGGFANCDGCGFGGRVVERNGRFLCASCQPAPCDACGKPASPLRYGPTCAACVAIEEGAYCD